jgi:hypothetical protein
MKVIKRQEAIAQGLSKYFTNKECKHGHISERYVTNRRCIACERLRDKKTAIDNVVYSRTLPRGRYSTYKFGAMQRNLNFSLTIEEFTTMWQLPCTYCGDEIDTIGLDRVDNTKGYTIDNVVPCCTTCNRLKKATPVKEWIDHMVKIINNIKK